MSFIINLRLILIITMRTPKAVLLNKYNKMASSRGTAVILDEFKQSDIVISKI
jgi:hypothetical protein